MTAPHHIPAAVRRHRVATNAAVLDALGMGDPKLMIVSATVNVTAVDELPTVTIKRYLSLTDANSYVFETHEITSAKRIEQPGFDLDVMCKAAKRRLHDHIDDMATDALQDLAGEMVLSRRRLGLPIRKQHLDACGHYFDDVVDWLQFSSLTNPEPFYIPKFAGTPRATA